MNSHAKLRIVRLGWVIITLLMPAGSALAADSGLFDAIRQSDARAVSALLEAGGNPNATDEIGATPLMYAAALGSEECVRVLLDEGAQVNAPTKGGATALMWATGNVAKVRLLLDRGADANARLKDGTTALVTAARRGNLDVIRLLLVRGSDPKASAAETAELLPIVYGDHPEALRILAGAGIELKDLTRRGPPSLTNFSLANTTAIRALLDLGANPNPRGRFPVLSVAAFQGELETARLLIERGADPNAKSQQDVTPLMMAAAAPRPDSAMVQLLLGKGAVLEARDKQGRTALDWALTQGETEVARHLRAAGATATSLQLPPAAAERPRTVRVAIDRALAQLAPTSPISYEHGKCISCHNQILPLIALRLAMTRGVAVDAAAAEHPVQSMLEVWNGRRESLMLGSQVGGGANELSYGLVALAESGVPPDSVTDAATFNLLASQRTDGSWVFLDTRPPQADNGRIAFTAMATRGLDVYGRPGQREDINAAIVRAREYLRAASPVSTQDESFKLLGLVWSRATRAEISSQRRRLLALQRSSGGWGQLPTMTPDAYATGQALYALRVSGMSPKFPAYQKGVGYLLRTQLEDGTWFVRSRAFGFQPYFESGFPHGIDQFISASATCWGAIALAYSL